VITSGSHAARWSIPGVGAVHPCIDRVVIDSPFTVGRLMNRLPKLDLERASHKFRIVTPSKNASLKTGSVVLMSGVRTLDPWSLLKDHEHELGSYSVVSVEIAFDVFAASEHAAQKALISLIGMLSKRNHRRGFLRCEHKPDHIPPNGLVSGPTYYLENRTSGVNLKCYVRHEKLAGRRFGQPIMRLEWTLKRKPALVRHLGGNQIGDLLQADLNGFLERNLRLERVDHLTLGKVFRGYPLTASRNSMRVGKQGPLGSSGRTQIIGPNEPLIWYCVGWLTGNRRMDTSRAGTNMRGKFVRIHQRRSAAICGNCVTGSGEIVDVQR
jgi:hypothetical protein